MAEAAAADTPAPHLHRDAILHRFNVGHDHLLRVQPFVQVGHDALGHNSRYIRVAGRVGTDGAVLIVGHVIQRRHVHAGNRGGGAVQERRARVAALVPHGDIQLHDLRKHFLALTDVEQVEEVRDRLRVIGAGTAADHQRVLLAALARPDRDASQLQHIQHVGVAHLILQGKADEVEHRQRIAAFHRRQRQVVLLHLFLHIHPWVIDTLAPDALVQVQAVVQDADAEIGHTDLVGVGEAEGEPRTDRRPVLDDLPVLTPGVASGFLYRGQDHAFFVLIHGKGETSLCIVAGGRRFTAVRAPFSGRRAPDAQQCRQAGEPGSHGIPKTAEQRQSVRGKPDGR